MRPSPSLDEENANQSRLNAGPRLFGFDTGLLLTSHTKTNRPLRNRKGRFAKTTYFFAGAFLAAGLAAAFGAALATGFLAAVLGAAFGAALAAG